MTSASTIDDNHGLNRKELTELLGVMLHVPAESVHLSLDFSPEPILVIAFNTEIGFNAIRAELPSTEQVKGEYITQFSEKTPDGETTLDVTIENYDNNFVPPIPVIRCLGGCILNKDRSGNPKLHSHFIKKKKKKRLEELMERAVNRELAESNNVSFKIKRFRVTRKYEFNVPIAEFNTRARQFPGDIHRLVMGMEFDRIALYVDNDESPQRFELKIPILKYESKGPIKIKGKLKKTNYYYPDVDVIQWTEQDGEKVTESILEFDIQPKSLRIERCNPRIPVTKHLSARISFNLIRYVVGPFLTLLLPIYIVNLLIPFCCFFDLDDYGDIAAYLSSLLLTLVAHRQLIDDKQQSVLVLTKADVDFVFGIVFILVQMILFLPTWNKIFGVRWILFTIEELFLLIYISKRLVELYDIYRQNDAQNSQNILDRTDVFPQHEYRSLRRYRHFFDGIHPDNRSVDVKTFFSMNVKLMIHRRCQQQKKPEYRFPTSDMFRMRIEKKELKNFLKTAESLSLTLLYIKEIEPDVLCKMVFQCSRSNNEIPLEVHVCEDKKSYESLPNHVEYKTKTLKDDFASFNSTTATSGASKPDHSFGPMLGLLLRSVFIELTSWDSSFRDCCDHIQNDIDLFHIIRKITKENISGVTDKPESGQNAPAEDETEVDDLELNEDLLNVLAKVKTAMAGNMKEKVMIEYVSDSM